MKNRSFLFAIALLAALGAANLMAGDVVVIANPAVSATSISAEELKGVFLLTKSSLSDGSRAEPVLEKGGPAHEAFLSQYLAKTDSALQTYYRSLVFTGKGSMPKILPSDAEVVAYVAKTKGAIGYVSAGASVAGVKALPVK
jgi:ABC-type phosphate transport system substrate-binding protein